MVQYSCKKHKFNLTCPFPHMHVMPTLIVFVHINFAAALNIRLANCVKPFEGRVEHYYAGSWGTVCDDGWDLNDAKVVQTAGAW